jgi:hypothetical protein
MTKSARPPGWGLDPKLVTGIAGFAVAGLLVFEFIVRVALGPRPDLDETAALADFASSTSVQILTVTLTDVLMMACLIVFLAGYRKLIADVNPQLEWIVGIAFGGGLVFVAVTLVGDSMEAGGALDSIGAEPDPSAIRALTEGYLMMFGPISCVLIALVAATSGYVTLVCGALPRATGWLAFVVALLNIVAIPTTFGGTNDRVFYSVGGWGAAVFATFPWLVWVFTVSVVALRAHAGRSGVSLAPPQAESSA